MDFIRELKSVRPDRPYFLYMAFGATHSPHQAPREFIEKYRGRFDAGWDVIREQWYKRQLEMGVIPPGTQLAPRNPGVKPWVQLTDNEKRFALRLQEAFAGFLDHTDHQIGRLVSFLERMGEMDNTIIVLLSDNGSSQEGGPTGVMDEFRYFNFVPEDVDAIQSRLDEIGGPHSHSNIPWGWAQAGNSPLKWYKQNTFGGGVRDPLIIKWPARIQDGGGIRNQFHHVSDIVPTLLDMLKFEPPATYHGNEQIPISGKSMAYAFDAPQEKTRKDVQYFEMFGHRGIWAGGWKAVTQHMQGRPFNDEEWELYHLDEDFSESKNLAKENPEKLRELIDLWWVEAGKHGVLPLDDRGIELFGSSFRPGTPHSSRRYVYYPPISHLPAEASPLIGSRSWAMTADVERPGASADGVLVAQGTQNIGFSWYIKERCLVFDYNVFAEHQVVRSDQEVPVGASKLGVRFIRDGGKGKITLIIDGRECGTVEVPFVLRMLGSTGMDIGRDSLSPVTNDYPAPFPFAGTIHRLEVNLLERRSSSEVKEDAETAQRTEMARQ
jgi:arylsulfatase